MTTRARAATPASEAGVWTRMTACRRPRRRSPADVLKVRAGPRAGPIRAPPSPGTLPPPGRSCSCRRGNSRSGTASGRRGCAGTAPAARRPVEPRARPVRRARRHRSTRRRRAGSSRRSSCRPRGGRRVPIRSSSSSVPRIPLLKIYCEEPLNVAQRRSSPGEQGFDWSVSAGVRLCHAGGATIVGSVDREPGCRSVERNVPDWKCRCC
jgi:hypothetical protein